MLSTAELDSLRTDLDTTLPDSCAVNRVTRTPNDSGGWTEAWAVVATVDCRISAVSQRELARAGRIAEEADGVVRMPYDTDIRAGDTVTVGGATYDVSGLPLPRSEELIQSLYVKRSS